MRRCIARPSQGSAYAPGWHRYLLQFDADGADSAFDTAADRDVLRNNVAVHLCAVADQEIRSAQFAFDSPEHLRWTVAFNFADDRHARADARGRCRFRRLRPCRRRRDLFNHRALRLLHLLDDFSRICRCIRTLLGCLALETTQHVHLPFCARMTIDQYLPAHWPASRIIPQFTQLVRLRKERTRQWRIVPTYASAGIGDYIQRRMGRRKRVIKELAFTRHHLGAGVEE